MLINEVRELGAFVLNKTQEGGYLAPVQYNSVIKGIQTEIIEEGVEVFQRTQKITDALRKVTKQTDLSTSNKGRADYPSDYWHYLRCGKKKYVYDENGNPVMKLKPVTRLTEGELGLALDSEIIAPSTDYPAVSFYDEYLQFHPKQQTTNGYTLVYVKEPTTPNWVYTVDTGVPVFDEENSVDLSLPSSMLIELVIRLLKYYGVNLREQEAVQYSQLLKGKQ